MLVVLEGPDRVGKTTLFEALRKHLDGPTYVPNTPFDVREVPVLDLLQRRTLALWEALYNPRTLYVCDRSPFTSNPVYNEVYGRLGGVYPEWIPELRVLYLDATVQLLESRPKDAIPQDYAKVLAAYEKFLPLWKHVRINASLPGNGILYMAINSITEYYRELTRSAG